MSGRRADGVVEALQAALAAEHAAVYGYGVVGAGLRGPAQQTARTVLDAHRARRDRLAELVVRRGAQPVAAEAAYRPAVEVTSAASAAALAAALEERVLEAYAALAGCQEADLRRHAALAMQEAMGRWIGWRKSAGERAVPPALPGLPPEETAQGEREKTAEGATPRPGS